MNDVQKAINAILNHDSDKLEEVLKTNPSVTKIVDTFATNQLTTFAPCSLLHVAVFKQSPEAIKLLLSYGANPNETDGEGETPLMNLFFISNPNEKFYDCFYSLIDGGADIKYVSYNQADDEYISTPHLAAQYATDPKIIDYFLSHGVDLNDKDPQGYTIKDKLNENPAMVDYLENTYYEANGETVQEETVSMIPDYNEEF
jgi:ankyrin repeat protein